MFASVLKAKVIKPDMSTNTSTIGQTGQHDGSLTFFSGDAFSPSYSSPFTKGKHMVDVLNTLGLKAACIGNHEFDFGIDNASTMFKHCNFPWISTNLISKKNRQLIPGTIKYLTFEHNDLKIGVVGISHHEWFNTISEGDQLSISDPTSTIEEIRKSVDVLIALTHQSVKNDIKFAIKYPQIDLVLGGHDHEQAFLPNFKIVKSGTDFEMFSEIDFDSENSAILNRSIVTIDETSKLFDKDFEVEEILQKYEKMVREHQVQDIKPLFTIDVEADFRERTVRSIRGQGGCLQICDIVDLATKFLRSDTTCLGKSTVDSFVFLNGGTFRSNMVYLQGHVFTTKDLSSLLPWQVDLFVCKVPGYNIREIMSISDSDISSLSGKFLHTSSRFDLDKIDDTKKYIVITTDFLSNGGDGYGCLFNKKGRSRFHLDLSQILVGSRIF